MNGNEVHIWNYTGTPTAVAVIVLPDCVLVNYLTYNINDKLSNVGKLFVSFTTDVGYQQLSSMTLSDQWTFTGLSTPIYTFESTIVTQIFCNADNGIVFAYNTANSEGGIYAFFQSIGYALGFYKLTDISSIMGQAWFMPNLSAALLPFTSIKTNNSSLKSFCISKTAPNLIYGLDATSGLLYSGMLSGTSDVNLVRITQFNNAYSYISTAETDQGIVNTTLRTFTISNQTQINSIEFNNTIISSIAKNEETLEFLVSTSNAIVSYNEQLTQNYTLPLANVECLYAKPGEDINFANVPVYSLEEVVESINAAFLDALVKLQKQGSSLTDAPSLTLNSNGTLTLNYPTIFTQTGNAILFNNPLINLCYFQNVQDTTAPTYFKLLLSPASTSKTQLSKSLYAFNQLDKILIQSNNLFVSGSFFGGNSVSKVITDVDVPIDGFVNGNLGQVLYYQPNFLRVFQMGSGGNAIDRIQMSILYRYRDGEEYQLLLPPNEAFSVKLDFIKRF